MKMKKTGIYLALALALGTTAFSSCSDEKDYPPVIVPADYGSGSWDNPMSVSQIQAGAEGTDIWITGYIVGWIDTNISNAYTSENVKFETPCTIASNIVLAASPDERDITRCIPVQLVNNTEARAALNLTDHPENLGKLVSLKGNAERYFGQNGFKGVSNYNFGDQGIYEEPSEPDVPDGSTVFTATKTSGMDAFTFQNIVIPEGGSYVWKIDSKYGLVASGTISQVCHASDGWAISPAIDLGGYKSATLAFRHAGNYFQNEANFLVSCTVAVRPVGGEWTPLQVPGLPLFTAWTFVDSGNIDLSAVAGKKVELGFHYVSTDAVAGTWEIDNITVTAAK